MNLKTHVLAIDQGTTGSTALVFDRDGKVAGRGYSEFTQHFPQAGWVEHDANEIWEVSLRVIEIALADAGIAPEALAAIGITNQRETVVIWDRETSEPVHRAIVWQDRRTARQCDELKEAGHDALIREKTGLVTDPYFSGTKVQWLLQTHPEILARARKGELAFGTMDTWLIWKLSGGKVHATDYTNASRTLLYNIHELAWDDELLNLFDVPYELLPEVRPSSTVFGETDAGVFFGASVPIAGNAGDQHAALFGQACFEKGMVKNTYGTGSFLLMHTGGDAVPNSSGLLTTVAWGIEGAPVEYALEGSVFISGAAIQWLRDGLGIIESAAETEAMARSLDGNDDVYFVPALAGLGAPHWDPYARGLIIGLTRGTTQAHLVRAALEAICYQSRDVMRAMTEESGIPLKELRADGGAVANGFLMQHQADILQVPIKVPTVSETTALGAAYLAGLAVEFWTSKQEISERWQARETYVPQSSAEHVNDLYAKWLSAVQRAEGWIDR